MINDYKYREEQDSSSINQRVSIDSCAFRIPLEVHSEFTNHRHGNRASNA